MSYSVIKVVIGSVNSSMTPLTSQHPSKHSPRCLDSVLFHDITVFEGGSRDLQKQVPLVPRSTWRHHQRQQCEKRERCIMGVVGKKQWRQLGEDEPVFSRERKEKERKKQIKEKETWPLIRCINREPGLGTAEGPAFGHSGPPPGTSRAWKIYERTWEKYKGSPRVKKMKARQLSVCAHVCTWEWERNRK